MKSISQKIAIAEFCGNKLQEKLFNGIAGYHWSLSHNWGGYYGWGFHETKNEANRFLPDYLHNLNDMNDALKKLNKSQKSIFISKLAEVLIESGHRHIETFSYVSAPAHLLAKAFLKTIGKWIDE